MPICIYIYNNKILVVSKRFSNMPVKDGDCYCTLSPLDDVNSKTVDLY